MAITDYKRFDELMADPSLVPIFNPEDSSQIAFKPKDADTYGTNAPTTTRASGRSYELTKI